MFSDATLAAVCPHCPETTRRDLVPAFRAACVSSTLVTRARLAAFLAQAAHESGEFQWWVELWGPTPQQRKYEPPSSVATSLGNTEPGDGRRYRGRGPFQLTGRANYRRAGEALGLPLEREPELVATIPVGCQTAVWYWDTHHLSRVADLETVEAFRRLTRLINGGQTGLEDRERYHAAAREALGLGPLRAQGAPA